MHQLYQKVAKYRDEILTITIIFFLTHETWKLLGATGFTFTDRVQYAPFAYRLNWQIISLLEDAPFSVLTWISISWIVSMILVYLILRPKGSQLFLFICWFAAVSYFGTIFDGEALLLVTLVVVYKDYKYAPLLLIPIALFREIVAFIGFLFLFFYTENKKEGTLSFIIAGVLYAVVRFILIGNRPYQSLDFFTIPYLLDFLLNPTYLLVYIPLIIILVLLTVDLEYKWMWLITAIPNFLFALFWEPQLWFPLVLVQLGVGKKMLANKTE